MRIAQINATCGVGSTGKICVAVSELLSDMEIPNIILYSQGSYDYEFGIKYSNESYKKVQALKSRICGNYGFNSNSATRKLIHELDIFKPDIVHIHNIHAHDCNFELLIKYLSKKNIRVFWTFHDCWVFTGYCTHFMIEKCEKWKTKCQNCTSYKKYSWFFDKSENLYNRKKAALKDLNLTIITPSRWLESIVKESFLKNKTVITINNGINLEIFKPTQSDLRKRYGISNKKVILGVSSGWSYEKGLDVFIDLAERLPDDYQVVLVGTSLQESRLLSKSNIIGIEKTKNQEELAAVYTLSDVFFNPSREENYPTVNMEAIACGTPVVTFDTGGSKEMLANNTGISVPTGDIEKAIEAIEFLASKHSALYDACINKSRNFDEKLRFIEYANIYNSK